MKKRIPVDIQFLLESILEETPDMLNVRSSKSLLKENPNEVDLRGGSGGDMKIARYQDSDAVAFFAFPHFAVYFEGGTHTDIFTVLYNVYGELKFKINKYDDSLKIESSLSDAFVNAKKYMVKNDVHVTDFDGMTRDMQSGPLKDFFDNESIINDEDPGWFRVNSGGLAGRLWRRKKIISFWNDRKDVIKKWNMLESLFTKSSGKFGNLSEYRVDWLERDIRAMPMTPATEVLSTPSLEDTHVDDEELKRLQKILHKLSPKKKKEALVKLGIKNVKYEQLADIVEKLGMTMAEYNHIMNVNEEVS